MKLLQVTLFSLGVLWFCATASGQGPVITSYTTQDFANNCTYTVATSKTPCAMGPGTTLTVYGTGFGTEGGGVGTCDCPGIILISWSSTKISGYVVSVWPNPTSGSSGINVETVGGVYSASVPYTPLAAQITKLVVGSCTWTPTSAQQCVITAGTQFTIYGNYFGGGPTTSGPQVSMCDCSNPTINSWDPGWSSNPTANNNVIVATAVNAECGNSIQVWAEDYNTLGSNPAPYTTCS
jgi:hypothetical protein